MGKKVRDAIEGGLDERAGNRAGGRDSWLTGWAGQAWKVPLKR